jgi:hypothetical protein
LVDFTEADGAFIRASGRDPQRIAEQLEMLRGKWKSVRLARPTTLGGGIQELHSHDQTRLRALYEHAAAAGRVSSFVPASGSGTRLFQSLMHLSREHETDFAHIRWRANRGDAVAKDALIVFDNIRHFAIWTELQRCGCSPQSLPQIFQTLFEEGGLQYHELPKGLIPFHKYGTEIRSAFEEHLRESAALGTNAEHACRIHFTVSPSHKVLFEREWERIRPHVEQDLDTQFFVDFSVQSPGTDTIAVDSQGNILRDRSGHITFRPGGHGSLLPNLASCGGDIVFIKNIDNVAREEFMEAIVGVRRLIGGLLLSVERDVHDTIRRLRQGEDPQPAIQLLDTQFSVKPQRGLKGNEVLREYAISQLNRPIRVCAVVGTLDHAGGRPFLVNTLDRGLTPQIVEGAEIDLNDPHNTVVFKRSRHFNPVDIACSIRDLDGRAFDLQQFAIWSRAIIAEKVIGGEPARLYENPGLWNGAMGLWNTIFVDVPDFVFNPVKSLSDLWAPRHRTADVDE